MNVVQVDHSAGADARLHFRQDILGMFGAPIFRVNVPHGKSHGHLALYYRINCAIWRTEERWCRHASRYNYGLYFRWWDKMMGTEHPDYRRKFESIVAPRTPVVAAD